MRMMAGAEAKAGIDDERPADVGQQLDQHDVERVLAPGLGGVHVVARAHVHGEAADDAHDGGCAGEGDGDDDVEAALPQVVQDQDEQHHDREGQQHVGDEGDALVPPAAEIAGDEAEDRADDIGDQGRGHAPDDDPLAAPDGPREHVAAAGVGAEPKGDVVARGEGRDEGGDRLVRIEQRQIGGRDRHQQPEADQGQPDHRHPGFPPGPDTQHVEQQQRRDGRQQHIVGKRTQLRPEHDEGQQREPHDEHEHDQRLRRAQPVEQAGAGGEEDRGAHQANRMRGLRKV